MDMNRNILEIIKKNGGVMTSKQLTDKGIARIYLSKMCKEGLIEKVDRGIYATKDYIYDEYYIFQLKYSKTIFSYNTALYLNGMSERTPINMDITVYTEYNPHRFKNFVNVHKVNKNFFDLGITEKISPQGMKVRVYNLERTICDIIKDKDCMDIELRNKAIKKCINNKDFNANLMFEYAKKMKMYDKVKNFMEAIV